MNWKLYFLLAIPFVAAGVCIILWLPTNEHYWAFVILLAFWIIYYLAAYYLKRKSKTKRKCD